MSAQLPARAQLTARLQDRIARAVSRSKQALSDGAGDYDMAWNTVQRVLVPKAAQLTEQAQSTALVGIVEMRARSVWWCLLAEAGLRRSDP